MQNQHLYSFECAVVDVRKGAKEGEPPISKITIKRNIYIKTYTRTYAHTYTCTHPYVSSTAAAAAKAAAAKGPK